MNEIVPIVGGLIVGLLLHLIQRPRLRLTTGVLAAFAVGFLATVVSGEYRIGWEYLLFDVPLSALCSAGSYLAIRRWSASTHAGQAQPSGHVTSHDPRTGR